MSVVHSPSGVAGADKLVSSRPDHRIEESISSKVIADEVFHSVVEVDSHSTGEEERDVVAHGLLHSKV